VWVEILLAIMILDFTSQYVVHVLLHKIPFMWRFHTVHHSDTHVDVTSGTRHHPIDFVFRETFCINWRHNSWLTCLLLFNLSNLTVLFTYFSHVDIQLPLWLDKAISYVFISPNTHKFRHHHVMPWTDTNLGNIFSFWNRIFGTFIYKNTEDILYGVDILDAKKSEDILYQLKAPFKRNLKSAIYKK
jgi:sterol desaturase/sphingolipid hydroxylase (fatty acid hydroxylase superfamily)